MLVCFSSVPRSGTIACRQYLDAHDQDARVLTVIAEHLGRHLCLILPIRYDRLIALPKADCEPRPDGIIRVQRIVGVRVLPKVSAIPTTKVSIGLGLYLGCRAALFFSCRSRQRLSASRGPSTGAWTGRCEIRQERGLKGKI